jgi:hypothetical protein
MHVKRLLYEHRLTTAACPASLNQRSSVWLICRARRTNGTDSGFLLITRRSVVRIRSPLLRVNQSPVPKGMLREALVFRFPKERSREPGAQRLIFPPTGTLREMEEFLTRLCTLGVNRSSPGTSKSKVSLSLAKAIDGYLKFNGI